MDPLALLAGLAGLFLSNVVNWLADSLPADRRVEIPRCAGCTAPRRWKEWSGLLGLAVGKTTCRYCGRPRGWRPVWVEIVGFIGGIGIYFWSSNALAFFSALVVSFILLLIVVIDLEHRLILHVVTLPAMLVALGLSALNPEIGLKRAVVGGVTGFLFFFLLYLLGGLFAWWAARRRGLAEGEVAFGFGDVTLAALIGFMVGFPGVIEALLRGILLAWLFSVFYLFFLALRKRYSAFSAIPYGPFLVLGCLYVYFAGSSMLERVLGM